MADFYANILLQSPTQDQVVRWLNAAGRVTYVSPTVATSTVIYHEDLSIQEALARDLSSHFACPALLVMDYGGTILLYQLYVAGSLRDAYVSQPHPELTLPDPLPGDPAALCGAFGMERVEQRIDAILARPTDPNGPYALAVNRHGELFRAMKLPLFAVGVGYKQIAVGELPVGAGFDPAGLVQTGIG